MKEMLKQLYVSGRFAHLTEEEILSAWASYITKEDIQQWHKQITNQDY